MVKEFCKLLKKAIIDEKEAIKGYQKFKETPQRDYKNINNLILEIKKDEEKHLKTLKKLNKRICK